jgi:hypothetical protein
MNKSFRLVIGNAKVRSTRAVNKRRATMNKKRIFVLLMPLLVVVSLLSTASSRALAGPPDPPRGRGQERITHEDRKAAAGRAFQQGALNPLMLDATAEMEMAMAMPGDAPRYFSHPNYANSPLPEVTPGTVVAVGNPLVERAYATDNASNVFVVIPAALPDGLLQSFQSWNQAAAGGSFQPSAGLNFPRLRPAAH